MNLIDGIASNRALDEQIRPGHARYFRHFPDEWNAVHIHTRTVRYPGWMKELPCNAGREEFLINIHLLADIVLRYACILAPVLFLNIRNIHMRDYIVMDRHVLAN